MSEDNKKYEYQISIRCSEKMKCDFEAVEGSKNGDKLQRLLSTYKGVENAVGGDIVENSIGLLELLKINLSKIEEIVNPTEENENEVQKLISENEELKKELEMIKGKYHNLNKEYSNLILRLELKGIKI